MGLFELIEQHSSGNNEVRVVWDTTKDQFDCFVYDLKTKRKSVFGEDDHDRIIDLVLDKLMLNTEKGEYTKGLGRIQAIEGVLWFMYQSDNKFLRSSKPEFVELDFEHPQEVGQNLNRSKLYISLSLNQKGFVRQDIKPVIDEGDAYTLGTHTLEKYRKIFDAALKHHYAEIVFMPDAVEYELRMTCSVSSANDKTFVKTLWWYVLFSENKKVAL